MEHEFAKRVDEQEYSLTVGMPIKFAKGFLTGPSSGVLESGPAESAGPHPPTIAKRPATLRVPRRI
jgi:hypothetical protein